MTCAGWEIATRHYFQGLQEIFRDLLVCLVSKIQKKRPRDTQAEEGWIFVSSFAIGQSWFVNVRQMRQSSFTLYSCWLKVYSNHMLDKLARPKSTL